MMKCHKINVGAWLMVGPKMHKDVELISWNILLRCLSIKLFIDKRKFDTPEILLEDLVGIFLTLHIKKLPGLTKRLIRVLLTTNWEKESPPRDNITHGVAIGFRMEWIPVVECCFHSSMVTEVSLLDSICWTRIQWNDFAGSF